MPNWLPAFLFPNIFLKEPIDGKMAAIANCSDPRVQHLSDVPVLAEFVNRFSRLAALGPTIPIGTISIRG